MRELDRDGPLRPGLMLRIGVHAERQDSESASLVREQAAQGATEGYEMPCPGSNLYFRMKAIASVVAMRHSPTSRPLALTEGMR